MPVPTRPGHPALSIFLPVLDSRPAVCYNCCMRSPFFAALLLLCLPVLPVRAAPNNAPVSVTRLTWHGWDGAVRLSNGVVEAVVVPSIGRIMDFHLAGHPETSPVFVNPDWEGKSVADADPATWAAFGGDKLWPSPQSEWAKHNVRAWPPDQTFDGDPEVAQVVPNGVRLTTPGSLAFAARATRTITLKPGEARLYIAQALLKDPDAQAGRDGFPMGVWSITQTRGDGTVFLPLAAGGTPPGFLVMGEAGDVPAAPYFTTSAGLLRVARDRAKSHKIGALMGAGAASGWVASLYGGDVLFSEHYAYRPGTLYPDGGAPAEVYTNAGATAYIEMELLGPLVPLGHGEKTAHDIYWQLQRLPRAPRDGGDAGRLVGAAMRT